MTIARGAKGCDEVLDENIKVCFVMIICGFSSDVIPNGSQNKRIGAGENSHRRFYFDVFLVGEKFRESNGGDHGSVTDRG